MGKSNGYSVLDAKTASPTQRGASRKRVRRACDECRLHKARCDGHQRCETCSRHNRECSYNLLPTECKGSGARIRILECRLIRAREHIQNLEREQLAKSIAANAHKISVHKENRGFHAAFSLVVEHESTIVASTGLGLIKTLLQPLHHYQDIRILISSDATHKFLCNSGVDVVNYHPRMPFCRLPSYDTMLQIAQFAFNNIFSLPSIIPEQCFHAAARKLYDVNPIAYTEKDTHFMPLFCGVMALGLLCRTGVELGYHNALQESLHYFEMVASITHNKDEYSSISEIQVGLVFVLYLVNTSKLDLACRSLQSITSSSIVRVLIQSNTVQSLEAQPVLFWVIQYLDFHISSLLGVNAQLRCPASATTHAINIAVRNVATYKRSDSTFLLSVSLAIAIESLRLIGSMFSDAVTGITESSTSLLDKATPSKDLQRWTDIEVELGTLESAFRRIFPDEDANLQISLARNELLMYFRVSQIMLHHKFLLHHSQSLATNDLQQINNINKGRACVMAASSAISSTSDRMEILQTTILTWLAAYTIFISAITLLVATASLENSDDYMQHTIEHTVRVAVQILKHATYGAGQKRLPYMNFLLAISAKTNAQFELILRDDMFGAATSLRSCKSESSRKESYPEPTSASSQSAHDSNRSQRRSPATFVQSPESWGFD